MSLSSGAASTGVPASAQAAQRYTSFDVPPEVWIAFLGGVSVLLLLDLLVIHRKPHAIGFKEATVESIAWIGLGLSFTLVMMWWQGTAAAGEYLAGYLIEKSLSVDNVFVWAVILNYFSVPQQYRFRVLFWGIFGALVLRAVFIFSGVALIERFEWIAYVFGALLLYTAFRVARHPGGEFDPERSRTFRLIRRFLPVSDDYDGQKMVTRRNGELVFTPLFVVLLLVESTDVVFAIDSIPAILAVSREPFIVFSSNALAILGLRALYFLLAGMADRFRYLHIGLGVILGFVGLKMILEDLIHVPTIVSLFVIAFVLAVAVFFSLYADGRDGGHGKDGGKGSSGSDGREGSGGGDGSTGGVDARID